MSTTPSILFRGAATTGPSTLFTCPGSTTTIVTEIMVANTTTSGSTFNIGLNGISVVSGTIVAANDTTIIPCKQVLTPGQTIAGSASATTVNFSICGIQIV